MQEAVIAAGVRTPFGRFGGSLKEVENPRLGAFVIDRLLERAGVEPSEVDEVIMGTAVMSGSVLSPTRQAVLLSRLPESVPSMTVDRACCSGMTAVGLAARAVRLGEGAMVVAGGAESMSTTPLLLRGARWGNRIGNLLAEDFLLLRSPYSQGAIAKYVGEVALERGVSREMQDAWAVESHLRYRRAYEGGFFEEEIVPVRDLGTDIAKDECPRADTGVEKLARLRPVYESPTVTAGNAPPMSDGAVALAVCSREFARTHGLEVLGVVHRHLGMSGAHNSSAYLPGEAILRLLGETGRSLADIARIEINEAFAATPLVSLRLLAEQGGGDEARLQAITNVNGGSVALGHPLGASGARITLTLIRELRRIGGGLGVAAVCGGYGQTDAILVEV